jgi:hypothetical protein
MMQYLGQNLPIYHIGFIVKVARQKGLSAEHVPGFQKSGLFINYRHIFTGEFLGS